VSLKQLIQNTASLVQIDTYTGWAKLSDTTLHFCL